MKRSRSKQFIKINILRSAKVTLYHSNALGTFLFFLQKTDIFKWNSPSLSLSFSREGWRKKVKKKEHIHLWHKKCKNYSQSMPCDTATRYPPPPSHFNIFLSPLEHGICLRSHFASPRNIADVKNRIDEKIKVIIMIIISENLIHTPYQDYVPASIVRKLTI